MHRLPPFPGLVAFDAVLRHGSVTRAAAELGLTQSAVSHRLRALEEYFGTPLLERLNPGLRPTPAGERLARDVAPLLGTLAGGCGSGSRRAGLAAVPDRGQQRPARLVALAAPADLAAAFPAVAIEVTTRESSPWDGKPGTVPEETDLALLWIPREAQASHRCEVAFPAESVFRSSRPCCAVPVRMAIGAGCRGSARGGPPTASATNGPGRRGSALTGTTRPRCVFAISARPCRRRRTATASSSRARSSSPMRSGAAV